MMESVMKLAIIEGLGNLMRPGMMICVTVVSKDPDAGSPATLSLPALLFVLRKRAFESGRKVG